MLAALHDDDAKGGDCVGYRVYSDVGHNAGGLCICSALLLL